jgi:DNA invertase Pin-like site-specific DNA recombinase
MIKCCIYVRSSAQTENSNQRVAQLVKKLIDHAYKRRIIVRQVFIDFNADTKDGLDKAPCLMEMVRLIQTEYIDHVLVTEIGQISRSYGVYQTFIGLITAFHTTLLTTEME